MSQFVGRHNSLALFSTPENSVVINTDLNLVVEAGDTDALLSSREWTATGEKISPEISALVELSFSSLKDGALIASSNARLYTIPAGVQSEAKKALEWHAEHHRGGTPVGLNTARTLAKGGQIGLHKVRHIAKYFPRHEVDKKGKGYQPGEPNFPSNGRIAWALWGGDAGHKWASTIVEREDKKSVTADGSPKAPDNAYPAYPLMYQPGQYPLKDFDDAGMTPESVSPQFLARVRLDGSGIDRCYKVDLDGSTHVWDGSGWDNLGNPDGDCWTHDKMLDDPRDNCEKSHILVDPDSAIIICARLSQSPFDCVSLEDIDKDEAQLAAFAIAEEDWDFIDYALTAGAPVPTPTAPNAKPEDSNINMHGIFDKNPSQTDIKTAQIAEEKSVPPMDAENVHDILLSFPVWVQHERINGKSKPKAGHHHPLAHKWIRKVNGLDDSHKDILPSSHNYHPVSQVVAAGNIPNPADVAKKINEQKNKLEKMTGTKPDPSPSAVPDKDVPANTALTPKSSDVQTLYFAIVSPDDPRAVMSVIAVVPASSTNASPMVYSRVKKAWQRDPKTLADLKSPTPPPVVPLEPSMLNDVLQQVDGIQASALFSYDHALTVMFGPRVDIIEAVGKPYFDQFADTALVAAKGGFDKNRGQAEKLRRYWTVGKGGAKIRWGQPGDWSRCVRHLSKFLGVRAKGYCQLRHHDVLGIYTSTHAKLFHEGKGTVRKLTPKQIKSKFSTEENFDMEQVWGYNTGKPTVITDKDLMMPMEEIHGQHDHLYDENWKPDAEVESMMDDPAVCEEMCNYSVASDHSEEDPCWDGYKQIGFKEKNGKHVPNCVNENSVIYASVTPTPNADRLRNYWTFGAGGDKVRWGDQGDWTRCVQNLSKYFGSRSAGYCALRKQEMTGAWVGDAENQQVFARITGKDISKTLFSSNVLNSVEKILEISELASKSAELKNRVALVASIGTPFEAPIQAFSAGAPFTIPLVIPEEQESGDGRSFEKGAISIRELPLPLMWQIKTSQGHDGSVVVGRIDHMERTENGIGNASGVFDTGVYGREAQRLVQGGFLRGVSADMDQFEAKEMKRKPSKEAADSDSTDINAGKLVINKARVMGVTIVPKPAFQECSIALANQGINKKEDTVIPNGIYADDADSSDALSLVACGMVASSIPVTPPADWFADPKLDKPTPLTVDDSGRVFGHIAAWHVDHIGLQFGTKPPRSRSNYAYFHTGVIRADNGTDYPVGQLTLAGGHASLDASAAAAAKHYDDTASAIADVHAGEDRFGIWVAGALRPSAQPEQIRALRASAPSGDWRPIQGTLELVAVCQVNVPGFPIARARVASGAVMALVAAGAATLAKLKGDPMAELNDRMAKLEAFAVANRQAEMELAIEKFDKARTEFNVDAEFGYIPRKTREESAKKGHALPDGSFPIETKDDVEKAIHAYGRAKESHKAQVRKHIIKRAKALKVSKLIPDNWKTAESDAITASLEAMRSKIAEFSATSEFAGSECMPDGSYQIGNESELKKALESYSESNLNDRAKVKAHIKKRAKELGKSHLIPTDWANLETSTLEFGATDPKA